MYNQSYFCVCVCFLDIWTCWLESCQSGEQVKAPRGRKSSVTSKFFNSLPGAFSFPLALSHIVRSTDHRIISWYATLLPESQTLHPQSTLGLCGPSLQFNNSIILSHRTTCDIKAWIPSRCAFVFNPFSLICGCYHLFNSVFWWDIIETHGRRLEKMETASHVHMRAMTYYYISTSEILLGIYCNIE